MRSILAWLSLGLYAVSAQAQPGTFSSGSTGADGPLTYAPNLGVVYFPPGALGVRPNNIYNFTTITIGGGTTVRLSGWLLNGPVYWLALGDVVMNPPSVATAPATVDLSGQPGYASAQPSLRVPSEPGAGGYSGGVGALGAGQTATDGNGPGGGSPGAGAANADGNGGGGMLTVGNYLIPLIGGSGGGGSTSASSCKAAGGGGAGAGALLIASSTQISGNAVFTVTGGAGGSCAGGGSGGAVRLVANNVNASNMTFYMSGGSGSGGEVQAKAASFGLRVTPSTWLFKK